MRVLFLNEGNLGGHILGQGQLDEALRIGLRELPDVEARFAGLGPRSRWQHALATRGIAPLGRVGLDFRTLRWHLVQSLRASSRLRRELAQWPADAVHVHSHSIALTMAGTMRTTPVVLSLDATVRDWSEMPGWRLSTRRAAVTMAPSVALERRALRAAALVFAWTAWARRGVEREAPGATVLALHPGLDLERYRPAVRRERPLPRVLFVGGRFPAKGGEDLLAALAEELGRELELDIVTPAPVPDRPGVRVHRLGPSDPQLLELQQQADLLCLPTHGDTNPWVLLEAMACGTPVISTRVGAIPELLDDGRAGVLIEHGDRRALRDAVLSLLADPQRRTQLTAHARERCERDYDARRQVPQMIARMAELRERRA
jgi:glycosyltransferase involved in cell wall biosynthesis